MRWITTISLSDEDQFFLGKIIEKYPEFSMTRFLRARIRDLYNHLCKKKDKEEKIPEETRECPELIK